MCDVMYLDYLCFITKTEKLNTEDSARATHNQQKGWLKKDISLYTERDKKSKRKRNNNFEV